MEGLKINTKLSSGPPSPKTKTIQDPSSPPSPLPSTPKTNQKIIRRETIVQLKPPEKNQKPTKITRKPPEKNQKPTKITRKGNKKLPEIKIKKNMTIPEMFKKTDEMADFTESSVIQNPGSEMKDEGKADFSELAAQPVTSEMFKKTNEMADFTESSVLQNPGSDMKDEGKADFSELAVQPVTPDNTCVQYSKLNVPPDLAIISLEKKKVSLSNLADKSDQMEKL